MTTLAAWFLSPDDRGNPATEIDRRRGGGVAYTVGNDVTVLVHGRSYYRRLLATLRDLQAGCWLHFTDWRGDPDERLDGPGTEVAGVLADLARTRGPCSGAGLAVASGRGPLQRAGEPASRGDRQ